MHFKIVVGNLGRLWRAHQKEWMGKGATFSPPTSLYLKFGLSFKCQ